MRNWPSVKIHQEPPVNVLAIRSVSQYHSGLKCAHIDHIQALGVSHQHVRIALHVKTRESLQRAEVFISRQVSHLFLYIFFAKCAVDESDAGGPVNYCNYLTWLVFKDSLYCLCKVLFGLIQIKIEVEVFRTQLRLLNCYEMEAFI